MPEPIVACASSCSLSTPQPKPTSWDDFAQGQPAIRDLREARAALSYTDQLLAPKRTAQLPPEGGRHRATVLADVPQYDRTHVQGCVCKPAIAGGACCPSNIGSMGLQQLSSPHHTMAMSPGMTALSGLSTVLGLLGLYSGLQVLRGAHDAERNLKAVDDAQAVEHNALGILRQRLGDYPELPVTAQHVASAHRSVELLRQDLAASRAEQRFHRWVPGRLQMAAGLAVAVTSGHHLLGSGHAMAHGAALGVAVNGLFVLYGGAMAAKNLWAYWADRRAPSERPGAKDEDLGFLQAGAQFVGARREQKLQTGLAWLGVGIAGLMGAAVSVGALAMPHAWALTGAVTLVAGVCAMWSNSCSRYDPHLPVSPHMQRQDLARRQRRAALFGHLQKQQAAIEEANRAMGQHLTVMQRGRAAYERAFAPQCGPEAFMVLPRAVAQQIAREQGVPAARRAEASTIQLKAVLAYLEVERQLIAERLQHGQQGRRGRLQELEQLLEPTCSGKRRKLTQGAQPPSLPADMAAWAASALQADSRAAAAQAEQLAVVDGLIATCRALQKGTEPLAAVGPGPLSEAQQQWLTVRFEVMQLCGILRDGVSDAFVKAHGVALKTQRTAHMLPLGNIYPLPEAAAALQKDAQQDIEALFVHALFNPRRNEAEMDYLLALNEQDDAPQEAAPKAQAEAFIAPAASSATCCSRP